MKFNIKSALAALALGLSATAMASEPVAGHVVFIGLDGWTAASYEKADMPFVKKLASDGALTLSKRSVLPSSSAINWASIFMGVPPEVHGYLHWGSRAPELQQPEGAVREHNIMPTIFQTARRQRPDADLAVFAEWKGINYLVDTLALNHHANPALADMVPQASEYIIEHKPTLIAVIFDRPDHPGHDNGWCSPEYYDMLAQMDKSVADIFAAVEKAGMMDDTVFIITADHGGLNKGHGGTSMEEMLSPFIIYGKNIKPGQTIGELVMSPDMAPTMAHILGLEPEGIWTGRPPLSVFK